jgi:hypothetical protein
MPIVYALTCKDPTKIYFGSSIQSKEQRYSKHKNKWKTWKNGKITNYCASYELFEIGDVEIHLVMDCPDVSELELRQIEQIYLDNCECVNIKNAYQSEEEYKEYQREYQQSEKYKNYKKEYQQTEKRKNYEKERSQKKERKEYRKNYMKEYCNTEKYKFCDGKVSKNCYDFETILMHELGHMLGLEHTKKGLMSPYVGMNEVVTEIDDEIINSINCGYPIEESN